MAATQTGHRCDGYKECAYFGDLHRSPDGEVAYFCQQCAKLARLDGWKLVTA